MNRRRFSVRMGMGGIRAGSLLFILGIAPVNVAAQQVITQAQQTIQVERGKSALLRLESPATRVVLGDPEIADAEPIAPGTDVLILGRTIGTTNLLIWQANGIVRSYRIEVVPDIGPLQDQIRSLFPDANITVRVSGNAIILSGAVRDPSIVRRVIELAQATGAPVINNIQAPTAEQVLLHVRFAEISRSALSRLSVDLFGQNVGRLDGVVGDGSVADVATLAEGIVQLFLIGQEARLDAVIRALRSRGEFRSLAEPNLIALNGQQATFLAGGEFPFPSVQAAGGAAGAAAAVTIQFREFGVRLTFTPNVTAAGTIRLAVAPEVSSLDFANALTISGFQIPALLTRRAETTVELAPGQHLAIAGLLDNTMSQTVDKIPLLGDLPVLGALFRSKANQQERTELLVLVTPYIVEPTAVPPPLPPGEPGTWRWDRSLQDTVNRTMPQVRRPGN